MSPFGFDDRQQSRPEDDLERRIAEDIIPIKAQGYAYETSAAMIEGEPEIRRRDYISSLTSIVVRGSLDAVKRTAGVVGKSLLYGTVGMLPYKYQMAIQEKLGQDGFAQKATDISFANSLLLYGGLGAYIAHSLDASLQEVGVAAIFSALGGFFGMGLVRVGWLEDRNDNGRKEEVVGEPIVSTLMAPIMAGGWLYRKGKERFEVLDQRARENAIEKRYGADAIPALQEKVPLDDARGKGGGDA